MGSGGGTSPQAEKLVRENCPEKAQCAMSHSVKAGSVLRLSARDFPCMSGDVWLKWPIVSISALGEAARRLSWDMGSPIHLH